MDQLRVGIVGAGYIAGLHSAAYKTVPGTYPDAVRTIKLHAIAEVDRRRAADLQRRWGWQQLHEEWRQITQADEIDLVDICVPNHMHAEIAIDALEHGKHVICEKPLADTVESAARMAAAAASSDRVAQVCFYYRTWPAVAHAARLIHRGAIGPVKHFRGWMLQDYAAAPGHDLGWRADRSAAGAGAAGDLGSHIIDIARHLCGDITHVAARTRSAPDTGGIDEMIAMLVEFDSGATGVLEAGWAAHGHKADLGFDVIAEHGAIRFSWENANELHVLRPSSPEGGMERTLVGPLHPGAGPFAGVPGQGLGYRDAFTIGIGAAIEAIAAGERSVAPTFRDGLRTAEVLDAAAAAATGENWVSIERRPP
jgi:predicted dehydrogenase